MFYTFSKKKDAKDKRKEKARHAEEKKQQKAREKQVLADQKKQEKLSVASGKLADAIVKKAQPVVASLSATLARPACAHLPVVVLEPARRNLCEVDNLLKAAMRVVADHNLPLPVSSMKEVSPMIAAAKRTETLVTQFLNQLGALEL